MSLILALENGVGYTKSDFLNYQLYDSGVIYTQETDLIYLPTADGRCAVGSYYDGTSDIVYMVSDTPNVFDTAQTYFKLYWYADGTLTNEYEYYIQYSTSYEYDAYTYYVYVFTAQPLGAGVFQVTSRTINSDISVSTISTTDIIETLCAELSEATNPCIDIELYTQGSGTNTLYTFIWSNLQNIPANYTEEDFKIWIGSSDVSGDQGLLVGLTDYEKLKAQYSYGDLHDAMANTQIAVAEENGYFFTSATLLYVDENGDNVVCNTYCFKITTEGTVTSEETETGGDVTINENTSPKENDSYDGGDGSLTEQAEGQEMSVDNLLTTSYVLTEDELVDFGYYLWSNDLQSSIYGYQTSMIENILSCKRIPFDVPGTETTIKLGNIDTNKSASKSSSTHIKDVGSVTPTVYNNSWLAFEPATVISIYLPYIGIEKLQTNLIYYCENVNGLPTVKARTINVKYYFDIVYGSCVACVYTDGVMIASFNGSCGIDIPITASNRASNELSLIKQGANTTASTIGALTSGNVFGALGGFIQGNLEKTIEEKTADIHFTTSGGFSSQVASYLPGNVTLFIEHPNYTEPSTYKHDFGYPCNLSYNLSDLEGFTVLGHNIEIDEIPCLDEERDLLLNILTTGIYL